MEHKDRQENRPPLTPTQKLLFRLALLWDLLWKALAIHRAIKVGKKKWILPLTVLNTLGIFQIWFLRKNPVTDERKG